MKRFVNFAVPLGALFILITAAEYSKAQNVITPHPGLEQTSSVVTKQLGNFGESFVDAGLRARGFEVFDGNIGVNGIDKIAVKRAANGELMEIRFIEVKTRQGLPEFKLAITKDGPQLSEGWTKPRLEIVAREHPDAVTRRVANEVIERMKVRPEIVRRELHGIAVEPNKYIVMTVDDAGRITGVAAEGRLTSLLRMLAKYGTSEQTRVAAFRHLARFDQLQAAVAKVGAKPTVATKVGTQGLKGITKQAKLPATKRLMAPRTAVIVENGMTAKQWAARLAKQPGVLATGLTFAVDEAFTGWEYYNGNISNADFQRQTAQNAFKAAAVGIGIQLVYILSSTPHGLVLMGVGIVAYVAADQVISAYDDAFVPKVPAASELQGMIPNRFVATLMLEDVAVGQGAWAVARR